MKARSKIFSKAILCALIAALTLVICIPVAAATNSTTLMTSVPASFPLQLEIQGKGTVTINGESYTESKAIQIARNMDMTVQVVPAHNNSIKVVMYNGNDITANLSDGSLKLAALEGNSKLQIVFSNNQDAPQTGDQAFRAVVIAGISMMFSLPCLLWVMKSKKKISL